VYRLIEISMIGAVLFAVSVNGMSLDDVFPEGIPVNSADQAVEVAFAYLGDLSPEKIDTAAIIAGCEMATYVDSTTPFLGPAFNSRRVWLVTISNVRLLIAKSYREIEESAFKDMYVSVDSITGHLIEIKVLDHGTVKSFREERPTQQSAEGQLETRKERYVGLPDSPPRHTFVQTLQHTRHNPHLSKEISAVFILWENYRVPASPHWIVSIYGAPPWLMKGPENQRNHSRTFVRDENGHHWANNSPQPVEWPPPPRDQRPKPDTTHDRYPAPVEGIPVAPDDSGKTSP